METLRVGNIGTVIQMTISDSSGIKDVSGATVTFTFRLPDGTITTRPTTFTTDGEDGKVQYATVLGDLSQAGTWAVEATVAIGGSGTWKTEAVLFVVAPTL